MGGIILKFVEIFIISRFPWKNINRKTGRSDGTWDGMRNVRKQLAQAAQQYDVEIWQSEWSMLGDGYSSSEFIGYDQATEMDIALYMSKVIHNDLTIAGVSSWSYWTSMDIPRWGHKNRFLLISLEPSDGVYGDIEKEGTYKATPFSDRLV